MTGIFKANTPYNNFLLFIYGLILKLPMFINPIRPELIDDGFLYKYLLKWLQPLGNAIPILYSLIAFLLLYIQAIGFNRLVNNQRLLPKPNYLTGMSYLLITSVFSGWNILSASLIINTAVIWILSQLCNLSIDPKAKTTLFNIGMVTGISGLLYFPSIAFSLLIIVGVAITRPFKLQEWLVTLIGIAAPYYFLASWLFLTNRWNFHLAKINVSLPHFHSSPLYYVAVIFILSIITIGIYFIQNNMSRLLVQSRKSWSLIYLYFIVALFVPLLNGAHSFHYWILTAVPISAFSAAAFLFPEKKWFAISIHWALVALAIVTGYFINK